MSHEKEQLDKRLIEVTEAMASSGTPLMLVADRLIMMGVATLLSIVGPEETAARMREVSQAVVQHADVLDPDVEVGHA